MGIILIIFSAALFIAVSSSPLLGALTAESALLFTIIIGPLCFIYGSRQGANKNANSFTSDFFTTSRIVFAALFIFMLAAYANSLRFESCAENKGVFPFLILAVPVLLLNLITGIWLGKIVKNSSAAIITAILIILIYLALQIYLWWLAPSLRFFNHNLVVINGDLLTGQGIDLGIMIYRCSTFFFALTLLVLGNFIFKNKMVNFSNKISPPNLNLIALSLLTLTLAFYLHNLGDELIAPSRFELKKQYSLQKKSGILVLHADPAAVSPITAEAILAEGNLWLARLNERSGITASKPIDIWLHADTKTQKYFTGAKNVHFTLPAHREIHISSTQIPHPTLGHELAHVLLGQESTTLFGLIGTWGFFPNNGLNEGLAVFLTPELMIVDDLTLMEQSAAIYRLNYLKDFEELFSVKPWSFWSQSSSRAYVMAGALLQFAINNKTTDLKEQHTIIKKLARAGQIYPKFLGAKDWNSLATLFSLALTKYPLPLDALGSIRQRFYQNGFAFAQCSTQAKALANNKAAALLQQNYKLVNYLILQSPENKANAFKEAGDLAAATGEFSAAAIFYESALDSGDIIDKRQEGEILESYATTLWELGQNNKAQLILSEIKPLYMPLPLQRQIAIKKALIKDANHDPATLKIADIIVKLLSINTHSSNQNGKFVEIAWLLADKHFISSLPQVTQFYGQYLLTRAEINGLDYNLGVNRLLNLTRPSQAPFYFQIEINKLLAQAYAALGEFNLAYEIYLKLTAFDLRPADHTIFTDLANRALLASEAMAPSAPEDIAQNRWLLGIWQNS